MHIKPIATIHNAYRDKFGIPRQSGLVKSSLSYVVFEQEYRTPEALRGIESYSHLWLIWHFSDMQSARAFSPTVRPPRLGGNTRVGVFATRSPNRPNSMGLSSVRLRRVIKTERYGAVLEIEGADILSGTAIFDIKPYIPYSDSHPDAIGSFADRYSQYALKLDIRPELEQLLDEEDREAVADILRGDARPSYQQDSDRIYTLDYGKYKISFSVKGDTLQVLDIKQNDDTGDDIYEYMRMHR